MKKHILSLVLALVILPALPTAALAARTEPAGEVARLALAPAAAETALEGDDAAQLFAVDAAALQPVITLPDAEASRWYGGAGKSPMTSADWQTGRGGYTAGAENSGAAASVTLTESARSKTAQYILQPFTLSMEVPAYTTYAVTFATHISLSRNSDGSTVMFMTLASNDADAAYGNSYLTGQEEDGDTEPTYLFRAHANTRAYTPSAEMTFAFANAGAASKRVDFPLALVVGANQASSALASYQHQLEAKLTFTAQSVTAQKTILYTENGTAVARQTFNGDSVKIGVTPTKADYIFTGWKDDATGTIYQVGDTYTGDQGATMAAQWRSAKIRVTFSANGGGADAGTEQTIGKEYVLPASPTRTGHTFDGWYTQAEGGSRITAGTVVPDQPDHTVYARWTPRTYTVTFNANGGSGDQSVRKQYGQTLGTLPAAPTRTGYTFAGWFTHKTDGDQVTTDTSVGAGDVIYYAHWTGNPVTVTLDGGTGAPTTLTLTCGGVYSGLTTPTKTGYTFDGWFTQGGAQVANGTPVTDPASHTLTARWTAKQYTVTFQDGGVTAATRAVAHGQPLGDLPAAPAKTGYTFGGWKNGGTAADPAAAVTQDVTYTAAWTANTYTVTFDYQGGTGTPAHKEVTFGGTYSDLPTPTKATYAFLGWANSAGAPVTAGDTVTTAAHHTLTAKWGRNPVTVTFDSQGGSAVEGRTVSADAPVGQLPTPTWDGHTFDGWYTAATGGARVTSHTPVPADVTYYARWTALQYTVNLDPCGGTVSTATQTAPYGGNYSLPTPERTGYTFNGWFTAPTDGTQVESNAAVTADHRTLYAHWTANQYTVTFTNGSKVGEATVTYGQPYGDHFPAPPNDYQVYSWYLDTKSNKVYPDTIVTTAADHTLKSTLGSHDHGGSTSYSYTGSSTLNGDGTGTYSMSGNKYLGQSGDSNTITTARQIVVDVGETRTVNLCLNGQALTSTFSGGPAILVQSGTLNICDCQGGGKITSASASSIVAVQSGGKLNLTANLENTKSYGIGVRNSGTLTVIGGSVKGDNCGIQNLTGGHVTVSGGEVVLTNATGNCAGIMNEGGTLELTGGSVRTNTGITGYAIQAIDGTVTMGGGANVTGYAGVNLSGGTFTLNGGVVSSTSFFGIHIPSGKTATLTVNGGAIHGKGYAVNNVSANGRVEISGGAVTSTSNTGVNNKGALTVTGGAIQGSSGGVDNSGTATLSGGSILGNGSSYAYGFINGDSATLNLSGSAAIHGKAADMSLATAEKVVISGPLTGKYSVRTSAAVSETAPFAVTGSNSADYSAHFTAAEPAYAVRNGANHAVQLCKPHTCAHGVFDVAATSGASLTTGSYYLSASVTGFTVPSGATADLCLNGLNGGGVSGNGTLNLYNCKTNGTVTVMSGGLTLHWHGGKLSNNLPAIDLHLHAESPVFYGGAPSITGGKLIFHTALTKPAVPWVVRPAADLAADNPQFVFTSGWSGFMGDASPKEYFTTDRGSITVDMSETGEAAVRLKRVSVDGETVYADYNSGRVTLPAAPAARTGYIWSGWTANGTLTSSQYTDGQVFTSVWTPCTHPGKDADDAVWTTVTPATCTAAGSKTYPCSCGVTVTETVPKSAHTFGGWVSTSPDTHYKECSACHAHSEEDVHSWNEGTLTTVPNCTTAGVMTYTCTVCARAKTVAVDPLGHDFSVIKSDAAGHWRACSRDGCDATDTKEGHTFGAWITTAEPQVGVAGGKAQSCTLCGHTQTQEIPALPAPKYHVTYAGDKYTAGALPTEGDHEENHVFALSGGATLTRTGYTLAGWLLLDEGGKAGDAVLTGDFTMPARHVTFRTRWTRIASYSLKPGDTVVLEDGTAVSNSGGVITIDQGGDGQSDTTITLAGVDTVPLRTPSGDGKDYLEVPGGTTVVSAGGATVTLGGDGTVDILGRVSAPTGSTILDKDGNKLTVTAGDGANVDPDGVVTFPKDTNGKVTVEKDGKETQVTVPGGGEGLDVNPDGMPVVQTPNQTEGGTGGDDQVVVYNPDGTTTTITPSTDPDSDPITTDEGGNLVVPGGATVTPGDQDGNPTGEPSPVPDSGVTLHTHVFIDAWVNTHPTHHWHVCTTPGCPGDTDFSAIPDAAYGAHSYDAWASDDTDHWRACLCGAIDGKTAHTFDHGDDVDCNGGCGYTRHALTPYPAPGDGEGYSIDYAGETVTVTGGYEINTAPDGTGTDVSTGDKLTPGTTLYIRQNADDGHGTSAWAALPIPSRPAAPAVAVVDETVVDSHDGKLVGLTAGVAYEISVNGGAWRDAAVTADGEITGLAPGSYQVRAKVVPGSSFTGAPTAALTVAQGDPHTYTLIVTAPAFDVVIQGYAQPEAKAITIHNSGNSPAVISTVEVSGTAFVIGGSGAAIPAGGSISTWTVRPAADLPAGVHTATITVTHDDGETSEGQVTFTVRELQPVIQIDYATGALTGFADGGVYAVDGQEVTIENGSLSVENYFGNTISIVKKGDHADADSEAQSISIPAQPQAPEGLTVTAESIQGRHDGKISGLSTQIVYEISDDTGLIWIDAAVTEDGEITGLAPGNYQVRTKAIPHANIFAGKAITLTVATGDEKTYTLNVTAPVFDTVYERYDPPQAKVILIQSTGNSDANIYSVSADTDAFVIGGSGETVPAGGSISTWTVRPAADLPAGVHTATITVVYGDALAATDRVTFTVKAFTHAWSEWTITEKPTLDAPGLADRSCPGDGHHPAHSETGVAVPALSDAAVWTEDETQRVEPTETGYGARTFSSKYGVVTVAIPATGQVPTSSLSGVVTQGGVPVPGATVELTRGNATVATATTDDEGNYTFPEVAAGSYNVVVNLGDRTMTVLVAVADDGAVRQDLAVPAEKVSSVLVVEKNTPAVVVDGLDGEAKAVKAAAPDAQAVTVTMTVTGKTESTADHASDIKTTAQGKTLTYLEIKVEQTVDAHTQPITTTRDLMTVIIPFDPAGKINVAVYRCHGGGVDTLTAEENGDGEYIQVGDAAITLYVKHFSTYAIGYTETASLPKPSAVHGTPQPAEDKDPACPKDETCPAASFADLDLASWYHDGIHFCVEQGLMMGTSETTFAPATPTSRAMIATILWRLQGSPAMGNGKSGTFTDVPDDTWYTDAVEWAASVGIVKGRGDGSFGPDDPITREQLAAMLYRYEQKYGKGGFTGMWMFLLDFTDADQVSDWADEAMHWMTMRQVITGKGDNLLDPKGQATRAEAAAMLQRFLTLQ